MSIQRVPPRRSSEHQPSSRLGGSRLNFSDSLAFLAFHPTDSSRIHLDYSSSTGYYSAGLEACASRRGADTDPAAMHPRMRDGLPSSEDRRSAASCSARPGGAKRWDDILCLFWGCVPTRAVFGIAGREACDAFLRVTEHTSRLSAQLSWDSRANIKYPECQTIQEETSRKCDNC